MGSFAPDWNVFIVTNYENTFGHSNGDHRIGDVCQLEPMPEEIS